MFPKKLYKSKLNVLMLFLCLFRIILFLCKSFMLGNHLIENNAYMKWLKRAEIHALLARAEATDTCYCPLNRAPFEISPGDESWLYRERGPFLLALSCRTMARS